MAASGIGAHDDNRQQCESPTDQGEAEAHHLEENRLPVDAEDLLERGHDLPLGGVGLDAVEQVRHQVLRSTSRRLQLLQPAGDTRMVAPRPYGLQAAYLALLGLRTDVQGGKVCAVAVLVGIHPHDDPLVRLELALELEGGVGDLALEEPVLDASKHAALL